MRIGIVTLFGDNYGNKLQNLAVQSLLENIGCSADTIRIINDKSIQKASLPSEILVKFTPIYIDRVIRSRLTNCYHKKNERDGILQSIRNIKSGAYSRLEAERQVAFDNFTKNYIHLAECSVRGGEFLEPSGYDGYVCGSDQIWNPNYSSTCGAYFLSFAPEHKRIALAASFGLAVLPEHVKDCYRKWILGIPMLSVREKKGADIIEELTGRSVPVLSDPTLCIPVEDWIKIEKKPAYDIPNKYVLTYFLGDETQRYRNTISMYARQHNCEIINLFDWQEPEHYVTAPDEFLWLIHHADMMMTDSYHGAVFSILYHTKFTVFCRSEVGGMGIHSRMETLLGDMCMEKHLYTGSILENGYDFDQSDLKIAEKRGQMRTFLSEALEAIQDAANKRRDVFRSPVDFLSSKVDCTGCEACAAVCPVRCICMRQDREGFIYPDIDKDACIHCGLCEKICPTVCPHETHTEPLAYVGYSKNERIRKDSSSGGLFRLLGQHILECGGAVCGAGYNNDFSVSHQCVENAQALSALQGSKYVQSRIGHIYANVKERLDHKQKVFFTGTPCQVEGLLNYLQKEYDNLYTQDIICHGVPSPGLWKTYCRLHSRLGDIQNIQFRNKTYGWRYFSMMIKKADRVYIARADIDPYIRLFMENVVLRPTCYKCRFKKKYRRSDITLADCWETGTVGCPIPDDDQGLSMIFANTEKGRELLAAISDKCVLAPIDIEKAQTSQAAMTQSVPLNPNREVFFARAEQIGMKKTIVQWYGRDIAHRIKTEYGYRKYALKRFLRGRK